MPENTLKALLEDNISNKIVLPDFQRTFEWEITKQKSLLASTLIDLSIGALLFLRGNKDDFRSKALGVNQGEITPKEECLYLLDGQQRLTSLRAFFTDFFKSSGKSWDEVWASLYSNLRFRWFVCLKPQKDSGDFFGYNCLHFEDTSKVAEPATMSQYIVCEKIYKNKNKYWYHPNYAPKDEAGNELEPGPKRHKMIKEAAESCLVPLYTLFSGDNLHSEIIEAIGCDRLGEIQQEIKATPPEQRKEKVISYLSSIKPMIQDDIAQYPDDADFCEIYVTFWAMLQAKWTTAVNNYFASIMSNKISIMELEKDQVARAIAIFTAINEGGQKLSSFDLIVAKAAKDISVASLSERIQNSVKAGITISDKWAPIKKSITDWKCSQMGCLEDDNRIDSNFQDSFLNILSALVHTNFLDKQKDFADNLKSEYFKAQKQLEMSSEQINKYANLTLQCLIRAHAFLQFRCGIVSGTDLPYRLMLLPIAFVLADDNAWDSKDTFDKLEFWYWTSIFSGAYREGQNDQSCADSKLLYQWIVLENISPEDLQTIKSRHEKMFLSTDYSDENTLVCAEKGTSIPTAIHRSILQFVLRQKPEDFLPKHMYETHKLCAWECAKYQNLGWKISVTRKTADGSTEAHAIDLKLQDHHIFPLGTATKIGESSKAIRSQKNHPLNSPLNRTYISAEANRLIQDESPAKYFQEIFPTALAFHMAPEFSDDLKTKLSTDEDSAYIDILRQRFLKFKGELLKHLSNLVN